MKSSLWKRLGLRGEEPRLVGLSGLELKVLGFGVAPSERQAGFFCRV